MPAGIGYAFGKLAKGPVGQMARQSAMTNAMIGGIYGAFAEDTSVLGGALSGAVFGGTIGALGGNTLINLARSGGRTLVKSNSMSLGAHAGAMVGGVYGAFSDDGSAGGGALAGAAVGMGVGGLYRLGMRFGSRVAGGALASSRGLIGGTRGRAINPVKSTLKLTM